MTLLQSIIFAGLAALRAAKWLAMALLAAMVLTTLVHAQALNPKVTQENIDENICVSGWTKTVRPPVSYTNVIKQRQMKAAGIPWSQAADYELDHIVPLQLGGHPTNVKNLQLQPFDGPDGARAKDVVETRMKRLVCDGHITLHAARACMATDWHTCPEK